MEISEFPHPRSSVALARRQTPNPAQPSPAQPKPRRTGSKREGFSVPSPVLRNPGLVNRPVVSASRPILRVIDEGFLVVGGRVVRRLGSDWEASEMCGKGTRDVSPSLSEGRALCPHCPQPLPLQRQDGRPAYLQGCHERGGSCPENRRAPYVLIAWSHST